MLKYFFGAFDGKSNLSNVLIRFVKRDNEKIRFFMINRKMSVVLMY